MLLTELKGRRPRRAGKAVLEYARGTEWPFRQEGTIVLPERGDLQLYRLQPGWNQFIARFDHSTVWFGGTDENPFLVRIDDRPFSEYCRHGPSGFYKSLTPELPGDTYCRQGDIFATPIPFTWEEIVKAYKFIHGWAVEPIEFKTDINGRGIFGTRHQLKGLVLDHTVRMPETFVGGFGPNSTYLVLAEGTVAAPDHADMELKEIHALAQTRYLRDPQIAD